MGEKKTKTCIDRTGKKKDIHRVDCKNLSHFVALDLLAKIWNDLIKQKYKKNLPNSATLVQLSPYKASHLNVKKL